MSKLVENGYLFCFDLMLFPITENRKTGLKPGLMQHTSNVKRTQLLSFDWKILHQWYFVLWSYNDCRHQGATGFFNRVLLERERLVPDWPNPNYVLILEPNTEGVDGRGRLVKDNWGPYLEKRMKSFLPKPQGLENTKTSVKRREMLGKLLRLITYAKEVPSYRKGRL